VVRALVDVLDLGVAGARQVPRRRHHRLLVPRRRHLAELVTSVLVEVVVAGAEQHVADVIGSCVVAQRLLAFRRRRFAGSRQVSCGDVRSHVNWRTSGATHC